MTARTDKVDLHWGAFSLRLALSLVWLLASVLFTSAGASGVAENAPVVRAVCAGGIALPTLVWFYGLQRRLKKADELERQILGTSYGKGATFAITWSAIMAAVFLGAGFGLIKLALLLGELPPIAMMFSEVTAQRERRRLSKLD